MIRGKELISCRFAHFLLSASIFVVLAFQSKTCGLAVVTLKSQEDVHIALAKLDGYNVLNRPMIIRLDKFTEDDPAYTHDKGLQEAAAAAAIATATAAEHAAAPKAHATVKAKH